MESEGGLKRVFDSMREPSAGERNSSGGIRVMSGIEAALPEPPVRSARPDSEVEVAGPSLPAFLCAICSHSGLFHTAGTDGAGWCAGSDFCECGGFQG